MYKKVLVPLDGSELAECALSHVKMMVKEGFAGEATLLNVVKVDIPWAESYDKRFNINKIRDDMFIVSRKYLAEVESRLNSEGIKVKTEALESNRPASAIQDYAQKNGMEMIVMATHGYTGMKKLMLGSVALSVLHDSHIPVLLIRPESCRAE